MTPFHFAQSPGQAIHLAAAFLDNGHVDAAIKKLNTVLASNPDDARARALLVQAYARNGAEHFQKGLYEQAAEFQRKALELRPDYADVLTDLGASYERMGRLEDAIDLHRSALRQEPGMARAHNNLAYALLATGQWGEGFREYEYRWHVPGAHKGGYAQPEWAGEPLAGRHLLVCAEQGLGDTFQFARFLAEIPDGQVTFYLNAQPHLHALLQGLRWTGSVVREMPEAFDTYIPLMSLPRLFGCEPDAIPAKVPYLDPDPQQVSRWHQRLGAGGFKIGVNWQGNPLGAADLGRSVPLAALAPLARLPGIRLISLQKNHGLEQLSGLPPGMSVENLGEDFDSGGDAFVDTAAVMANLDLVITSDTSVAHLAGALGRPTWIMLQNRPDWRWLRQGDDCPWYPNARLYRQPTPGDWTSVAARLAADAASLIAGC
ncbi:MAG: glycosyltransferase family protein [Magnetospirillum sp.]|nr:glycosyltransferase family protein [Magnetospirillum sp.]